MAKVKTMDCEFKTVGIGKDVTRMSVSVPREKLSLQEADDLFTGSQISAKLSCDPNRNGDAEGQQTMPGCSLDLEVVADCHGFRASSDSFSTSLSMNKESVDLTFLSAFAGRKGTIKIERTGAAAGGGEADSDDNDDQ